MSDNHGGVFEKLDGEDDFWNRITEGLDLSFEDVVAQESVVQAFVVDVEDNVAKFVVTHVLHDEDADDLMRSPFDSRAPGYRTADTYSRWFSQLPGSYRQLVEITRKVYEPKVDTAYVDKASIEPKDQVVKPGDTVHIHKVNYGQRTSERSVVFTRHTHEFCVLPVANQDVAEGLTTIENRRMRLAGQMMRSFEHRERLEMESHDRVLPNEPFVPFADPDAQKITTDRGYEYFRARQIFGSEHVKDHFVDITAKPALEMDLRNGGVSRFSASGHHFIVPNLTPLGEGTPDDPLVEIEIHIHSKTVHDPAVGEQQAYAIIDGVKYIANVDPERSSQYFRNPGHDVYMDGFSTEDRPMNMTTVTAEQEEALARVFSRRRAITNDTLYRAIGQGRDFVAEIDAIDAETQARIDAVEAEQAEDHAIIASIKNNPLDSTISTGASLMVPRSMLDAVTVVFPSIE